MKVEVAVLDSPSLIVLMVFLDVKQHSTCRLDFQCSGGGEEEEESYF